MSARGWELGQAGQYGPNNYEVFGVAITEAQVDLLTGQIQVLYMYTCSVHMYVRVRVGGPIRAK